MEYDPLDSEDKKDVELCVIKVTTDTGEAADLEKE
jgi:hypothetical protein